ncbi:MAG TPA: DUF2442 domain-containing protein [bacterium]|nr:DUF2442 domain-containing protein [bacterium]
MTTLINKTFSNVAKKISFTTEMLIVFLVDGRIIEIPLDYFPSLRDANETQRNKWRFIGGGIGIHWEEIDEDISVENLLKG